jgi:hypothetical protein
VVKRVVVLLVAASCVAAAQDPARLRDALEWTVAQRGRMAQMSNPVVRVHGTASLGAVVCAEDPVQGSGLYREAITALHTVPDSAFNAKGTTILPAASFTGLWKYVVPAALKCDPMLAEVAANQRSRERIEAERRGAIATLHRAWDLIDPSQVLDKQDNNDRAAQIASAALDAADPDAFDFVLLQQFLSQLSDRAPDLADELFVRTLDVIMSAEAPDPDNVQQVARYVLTSRQGEQDSLSVNGVAVNVLTTIREEANPDDIEALIDTTARMLDQAAALNRNPQVAYALAWQLLSRARDVSPDKADRLEAAMANLDAQGISGAALIRTRLNAGSNADPESGDAATRDYWLAGRIQSALAGGHIEQARDMLPRVDDAGTRAQLAALTGFGDGVRATEAHSDQATVAANALRAGIKRSLLYTGIVATTRQLDVALQIAPLAVRDIQPLPAEQRIRLLSALAAALARVDVETTMTTLGLLVKAYNDAYVSPRRGKFDPMAARRIYTRSTGVDSNSDSSLILPGAHGLYEAVQTERGRRNFVLKAPGPPALDLRTFLSAAAGLDPGRLEAAILGLRDENTRAAALVRLGETRIRSARAQR